MMRVAISMMVMIAPTIDDRDVRFVQLAASTSIMSGVVQNVCPLRASVVLRDLSASTDASF
jgi:hypothetical protein